MVLRGPQRAQLVLSLTAVPVYSGLDGHPHPVCVWARALTHLNWVFRLVKKGSFHG